MTAQIICLAAARKARQIGREDQGSVFMAPMWIGALVFGAWLDALPRWPESER